MSPEAVGALSHGDLVALVLKLVARVDALEEVNRRLGAENEQLRAEVGRLRAELGKNSRNSSKPPSRDPAAERERQAEARRVKRSQGGKRRRAGKQPGSPGTTLAMSENPDEIVVHEPSCCDSCGGELSPDDELVGTVRRQVVDIPQPKPVTTEHQARTRRCSCCGTETAAAFPEGVRAPVSYGPTVKSVVAYLLAFQHIPVGRTADAMRDLFGLRISTGAIDAVYADAARRLKGFLAALVTVLRALPVLHADETTDRIGTKTCWMHVVSTGTYTLITASVTRGMDAVRAAGVLIGHRGIVVHDRLAMYWKLKAKHQICAAHLLRDLASVAEVASQSAWAEGLARLLVEINHACGDARQRDLKTLAPTLKRAFADRYDRLVEAALAANPEPPAGRKRDPLQRQSYNLAVAFQTHKTSILRYMHDLRLGMTNNQGERDLRPVKLHRKISSCFKSQAGAERFAAVRSYLSTTRKHDIPALEALTRLFNNDPWMPTATQAA
jgi:transposase